MKTRTALEPRATSFEWDAERRLPLLLTGFLLLSFGAHTAAFFLFQATYPQRATIPPPDANVTVLTPDIPEHLPMLAWVAAEDPALIASVSRAKPPSLATTVYKPSFNIMRSTLLVTPRLSEPVALPSGLNAVEFLSESPANSAAAAPVNEPAITKVDVAGTLNGREVRTRFSTRVSSKAALAPLRFLVCVDGQGMIRHRLLQQSSGDDSVDETVSANLGGMRFAPNPEEITWGFISITLGDDALAGTRAGE